MSQVALSAYVCKSENALTSESLCVCIHITIQIDAPKMLVHILLQVKTSFHEMKRDVGMINQQKQGEQGRV